MKKALEKPTPAAQFAALLKRVNQNHSNPADLAELRSLLNENPDLELWRQYPGPGSTAENIILNNSFGLPKQYAAIWAKRQEAMLAELGYREAGALERLMIHHVAICWLKLNLTEIAVTMFLSGQHKPDVAVQLEKRLTEVQKRFTRASESLARIRRLGGNEPRIQINIAQDGGQQVNVSK